MRQGNGSREGDRYFPRERRRVVAPTPAASATRDRRRIGDEGDGGAGNPLRDEKADELGTVAGAAGPGVVADVDQDERTGRVDWQGADGGSGAVERGDAAEETVAAGPGIGGEFIGEAVGEDWSSSVATTIEGPASATSAGGKPPATVTLMTRGSRSIAWAWAIRARIGSRSVGMFCEVGSIGGLRREVVGRTSPRMRRARTSQAS